MSLMGMDIGSTGAKAVVFSTDGQPIAECYREYRFSAPQPGWQQLDADVAWAMIAEIIREANAKCASDPVTALAVSAMGESMAFIGKDGKPVHPSILNFDNRTVPQARWWEERVGKEKLFQITGMPLYFIYSINKIIWIRENAPEAYAKLHRCLCFEDFVYWKLGCKPSVDYSLAARTMAFDVRKKEWSKEIMDIADVDRSWFSDTAPSGKVIGEVDGRLGSELGFRGKVKVVTGGHDQPSTALGAGILESGIAVDGIGTVECITPAFDRPILTKQMLDQNYACYPHTVPDLYCTVAFNFTGGSLLKWFRDTFGDAEVEEAKRTGKDVYDIIIAKARKEPSDLLILPHFTTSGTPHFDSRSKGAILGLSGGTTRADIIKAILEGVTYEIKLNIENLEGNGVPIRELRATGGGSKSAAWLQLKADMYNRPVASLNVNEAGCMGCAILAGVGTGEFKSIREAIGRMLKIVRLFEPDGKRAAYYEDRFPLYARVYPAIADISHQI